MHQSQFYSELLQSVIIKFSLWKEKYVGVLSLLELQKTNKCQAVPQPPTVPGDYLHWSTHDCLGSPTLSIGSSSHFHLFHVDIHPFLLNLIFNHINLLTDNMFFIIHWIVSSLFPTFFPLSRTTIALLGAKKITLSFTSFTFTGCHFFPSVLLLSRPIDRREEDLHGLGSTVSLNLVLRLSLPPLLHHILLIHDHYISLYLLLSM